MVMEMTRAQVATFAAAHGSLVATLKAQGLELDYSLESLKNLEALFGGLRQIREEEPARFRALADGFWFRTGAYVAEVFLRAMPEARISLVDGQLTVAMPSGLAAGVVKVLPLVRVAKLLHEEETLYEWAVVFLAMAGRLPIDAHQARGAEDARHCESETPR